MNLFNQYNSVIFDLDDTIYPEIEYLKKAYRFIAQSVIKAESRLNSTEDEIFSFLIYTFTNEGRDKLFQKMIDKFNINFFSLENFLSCLHNVPLKKNELKVYSHIQKLLVQLSEQNKLIFILTNGNVSQQRNKLNSLNIKLSLFKEIIYASSNGKEFEKPNPFFVNKILLDYSLNKNKVILIGDSVFDKESANNAGIDFLDVLTEFDISKIQ
jgi:putative hydrolase of the HAD superfamily